MELNDSVEVDSELVILAVEKTYYYALPQVIGTIQYHSRALRKKELSLQLKFTTNGCEIQMRGGFSLLPVLCRTLL